jgi:glyoxylase-like metal-dependent hydrolase (beta-lactamase superfamily II)
MLKRYVALLALVILIAAPPGGTQAQDSKTVVNTVVRAMGAENLRTLQLSGSGSNAGVGQNVNPSSAWPTVRVKTYTRQIDFEAIASSVEMVRIQNDAEQTQTQVIPANAPWAQQFDIWVTPYAFLKGAMANSVTTRSEAVLGINYTVVSYVLQNRHKVEGYIDDQNMVARVRTWVDNNVLGDMLVEAVYSDYKDFGGLKVPTFAMVKQGGFPTLLLIVNDAKANVPVTIPAPPAQTAAPSVSVASERIADGVFYLRGGTHHSVALEFADHVVLIEGPQNEQRSLAVIAEVRRLFPNKPLRYLVNTHHHFDHSGGLRTYVDAGVTIVTHEINKAFYERAFAAPRTLNPDRLEQSKRRAAIETVGDMKVLSDATRTLELHLVKGNRHNDGILMAFLPKEKILVEVDLYTPPAPGAPAPAATAQVNPTSLIESLEKLRLDFETILPLHGPGKAMRADLYAFAGKPMRAISELPDPDAVAAAAAAGPDAAMQRLVAAACTTCHNIARINNKQGDREAWTTTVTRMKNAGAEITDEQVPLVIDYLVRTGGQ